MWRRRGLLCGIILVWSITGLGGCKLRASSHVVPESWYEDAYAEGVYTGQQGPTPQLIVVDVTIRQGRIVAIDLRQHPAWKRPEEKKKLLRAVIAAQTVPRPAPAEEGSEEDRLLDAIEDALNKARHDDPSEP
jgi:uncharacterized protein with FMN-binding domain